MKVIEPSIEHLDELDGKAILRKIERIGRVCYKSEDKITDDSAAQFVAGLIKSQHLSLLEHFSMSVLFTTDRGVGNEMVRHRIASFAQESTRYCNYAKDKFGSEIKVCTIKHALDKTKLDHRDKSYAFDIWLACCERCESGYLEMLDIGVPPEIASKVLPLGLATTIVITMNLREWRHFFELRVCDKTGKAHPQMKEVSIPLLEDCKKRIPVVFDDLIIAE